MDRLNRAAHALGITVRTTPLPHQYLGFWHPDTSSIWVADHLTYAEQRCAIAHELEHARLGHDRPQPPAIERTIDEHAAHRLVTPDAYARAEAIVGSDPYLLADELDITVRFVHAWQRLFARLGHAFGA